MSVRPAIRVEDDGAVRRLVAAGLVDRTVGPGDGRTRALALTDRGTAALGSVEAAFSVINEHIDAVLTGDEVGQVADALRRLSAIPEGPATR